MDWRHRKHDNVPRIIPCTVRTVHSDADRISAARVRESRRAANDPERTDALGGTRHGIPARHAGQHNQSGRFHRQIVRDLRANAFGWRCLAGMSIWWPGKWRKWNISGWDQSGAERATYHQLFEIFDHLNIGPSHSHPACISRICPYHPHSHNHYIFTQSFAPTCTKKILHETTHPTFTANCFSAGYQKNAKNRTPQPPLQISLCLWAWSDPIWCWRVSATAAWEPVSHRQDVRAPHVPVRRRRRNVRRIAAAGSRWRSTRSHRASAIWARSVESYTGVESILRSLFATACHIWHAYHVNVFGLICWIGLPSSAITYCFLVDN